MADFLSSQMDYIYFFYGLAFFVMAMACARIGRPARTRLPWGLLGLFGVTHGLNEWLDLIAYSLGDTPPFTVFRLAVLVISFLFLAEFGRAGMERTGGRPPGRWVLVLLASFTLLGGFYGLPGLNAAARYALCLTGGLYSAWAIVRAYLINSDEESPWLLLSGIALGAYSVSAGLVVPEAGFLPASVINYGSFMDVSGMPVQLVRGVLAVLIAFFIATYYRSEAMHAQGGMTRLDRTVYTYTPLVIVVAILVGGWFITDGIGRRDKDDFIRLHLNLARSIASSFAPDHIRKLSSGTEGVGQEDYSAIREHLVRIHLENQDCTSASVSVLKGGEFVLIADGEKEGSPRHHLPGFVAGKASRTELDEYARGETGVEELREGGIVRDFVVTVPIFSAAGDSVARLALGFDASSIEGIVREDRLSMIVITCVFCLFSIAAFIAWFRTRQSLAQAAELELASYVAENEKKLRAITSALGEGVLQLDPSGAVVFMNPEAERLLGWKEEELIGRDGHDMLHHFQSDGTATNRDDCPSIRVLASGITIHAEGELFTRKDGSSFAVSYVTAPIIARGKVTGAVVAFQDITGRKQAEDAIRTSERSYRTLSENLPGMVYRITLGEKNRMHFFNEMVVPMTGFTPGELTKGGVCSLESRIAPEDLPKVLNTVNLSIIDGTPFQVEYRFLHKDGGTRYFHERGRTIMGEDGKPSHIDGVILDITDRKRAEGELYMFKFIVEGSGEEIYLLDVDGGFEYANEAACRSLGYRLDELRQMKMWQVDPAYDEKAFAQHVEELRKKDLPPFETEHVTRSGRHVTKEVKAARLMMDGREYICGILRDVTERKELERQRTDFFSIVTHDLKSPLSVIRGYTDMMINEYGDQLPPEVKDFAGSIMSSADKILHLVEDYLAVSRLESGVIKPERIRVNLAGIVGEAGKAARALASARNIYIEVDNAAEVVVSADPVYLQRALMNLVQNAVNYTPDGGSITISSAVETVEGAHYASLSVKDSGPGIAPDEREKIFERYYRSARTRGVKGSGLGLTIVKAVAEAHGGMVMLDSAEGLGSTFKILIPA